MDAVIYKIHGQNDQRAVGGLPEDAQIAQAAARKGLILRRNQKWAARKRSGKAKAIRCIGSRAVS